MQLKWLARPGFHQMRANEIFDLADKISARFQFRLAMACPLFGFFYYLGIFSLHQRRQNTDRQKMTASDWPFRAKHLPPRWQFQHRKVRQLIQMDPMHTRQLPKQNRALLLKSKQMIALNQLATESMLKAYCRGHL